MSNKFRKVLAAILAGTMVLGSSMVTSAAASTGVSGSGKGTGDLDIVRASDVFQVVLPTSAGTQFNYILNPTGVIAETNGAKYATSSTFANDGKEKMYFAHTNASGSVVSYATESEPIKAWNKSNVDVQIEVKAKLNIATPSTATNSSIEIANASVAGDSSNDRKIYIALRASGSNTAITASESTTTATIASASNAYETKVVNKEYKKTLKASASNATTDAERDVWFSSYSFSLTGDCNATKEWSKLDVAPPEVTLTWKIDKPDGAVDAYTDTTAHGQWSNSTLWLAKDSSTGFSTTGLTVEVSDGGSSYNTLASDKYSINDAGWVSVTWANIVAGIGSTPTTAYVRVTDGTTRYVFVNGQ